MSMMTRSKKPGQHEGGVEELGSGLILRFVHVSSRRRYDREPLCRGTGTNADSKTTHDVNG